MTPLRTFRLLRATGARAVMLLLLAVLAGCAVLEPEPDASDRRALSRARALWEREGPDSYRYVYSARCECPPTVARATWVIVEKGVVVDAEYVEGNDPIVAGPQLYGTVDSLFALVQRAYDGHAAEVRVRYDERMGYPVDVYVDWRKDYVDDEGGFLASELVSYTPAALR
jgi:hypothetical protein